MFSLLFLDLLCMEGVMLLVVLVNPIWQVIRTQNWLIAVSFFGWIYMITVMYAVKVRLRSWHVNAKTNKSVLTQHQILSWNRTNILTIIWLYAASHS